MTLKLNPSDSEMLEITKDISNVHLLLFEGGTFIYIYDDESRIAKLSSIKYIRYSHNDDGILIKDIDFNKKEYDNSYWIWLIVETKKGMTSLSFPIDENEFLIFIKWYTNND